MFLPFSYKTCQNTLFNQQNSRKTKTTFNRPSTANGNINSSKLCYLEDVSLTRGLRKKQQSTKCSLFKLTSGESPCVALRHRNHTSCRAARRVNAATLNSEVPPCCTSALSELDAQQVVLKWAREPGPGGGGGWSRRLLPQPWRRVEGRRRGRWRKRGGTASSGRSAAGAEAEAEAEASMVGEGGGKRSGGAGEV